MKAVAATFILILLLAPGVLAQATALTWEPELQLKIKLVGTPRVSPDGKRVVYTVSESLTGQDKSEFVSQIWMATISTKQNLQLTFGDKTS